MWVDSTRRAAVLRVKPVMQVVGANPTSHILTRGRYAQFKTRCEAKEAGDTEI